jgi:hypothetical protein
VNAAEPDWIAAYRASLYAFAPRDGTQERRFSLDGPDPRLAGLAETVALITAWNPASREMPRAWNEAANLRLARALARSGVPHTAARGSSLPGGEPAWQEDGFALHGLALAEARDWGLRWQQRALVWLTPAAAGLLFVADGTLVSCGVRDLGAAAA